MKFLDWNANVLDFAMNIMDAAEALEIAVGPYELEQGERMFLYRLLKFVEIVDCCPSSGVPGAWTQAVHSVLSQAVGEEKTFETKNGMRQIAKLFSAAYNSRVQQKP